MRAGRTGPKTLLHGFTSTQVTIIHHHQNDCI